MIPLRPIDSQLRHDSFCGISAQPVLPSTADLQIRGRKRRSKEGRALPSHFKVPVYWPSGRARLIEEVPS